MFTTKSSVFPWLAQLFNPRSPPHIPHQTGPSHNLHTITTKINLSLNRQLKKDTPVGCGFRLLWLRCVSGGWSRTKAALFVMLEVFSWGQRLWGSLRGFWSFWVAQKLARKALSVGWEQSRALPSPGTAGNGGKLLNTKSAEAETSPGYF